jgi:signal transduction histidine kinase
MNEKYIELKGHAGEWTEATSVDRARRKRLLEDYDKEETKRLVELKKGFVTTFKMTKEDYDVEVEMTDAEDLVDFYFKMEEKYGKYWKPIKK